MYFFLKKAFRKALLEKFSKYITNYKKNMKITHMLTVQKCWHLNADHCLVLITASVLMYISFWFFFFFLQIDIYITGLYVTKKLAPPWYAVLQRQQAVALPSCPYIDADNILGHPLLPGRIITSRSHSSDVVGSHVLSA